MKVVIDGKTYDGEKVPILLILSDDDKENLANMSETCSRYLCYPEGMAEEDANEILYADYAAIPVTHEPEKSVEA